MRDYKAMISHALKKLPANKVRKFTRGQNSRFGRAWRAVVRPGLRGLTVIYPGGPLLHRARSRTSSRSLRRTSTTSSAGNSKGASVLLHPPHMPAAQARDPLSVYVDLMVSRVRWLCVQRGQEDPCVEDSSAQDPHQPPQRLHVHQLGREGPLLGCRWRRRVLRALRRCD